MSEDINSTAFPRPLDIFATRVLSKAVLLHDQEVFQEDYQDGAFTGTKVPLKLYIINHLAPETETPNNNLGKPVKCVKLCKRILDDDPQNTMICTQKSKVALKFELVLIVEYEDNAFDVLTLPKNLSAGLQYDEDVTKAFVDSTVIDALGAPVIQHQNVAQPYETLVIKTDGALNYTNFEYTVKIPLSSFDTTLRKCELDDPTLQSYILLRNLDYEIDILDQFQMFTGATTSIWTTTVEFSLYEDIIDKLGIDQDIQIIGTPEYVCSDDCLC